MVFFPTLGRLPRTSLCLAVIVLAGLSEGFGIMLFVPLLAILTGVDAGSAIVNLPFARYWTPFVSAESLLLLLGGILAFVLAGLFLAYVQGVMVSRATHRYIRDARERYIRALFLSPLADIVERSGGEMSNQIANEAYRGGFALQVELQSAAYLALILIYFGFAAAVSWPLLGATVFFAILAGFLVLPLQRRAGEIGRRMRDSNHILSVHALEFLRGARLIKSSANEIKTLNALDRHIIDVHDLWIGAEKLRLLSYFILQALPAVLVTVLIGAAAFVFDIPTPIILTFILILARIAPRVTQFQQQRQSYAVHLPSFESVENAIASTESLGETFLSDGGRTLPRFESSIALDAVEYRHKSGAYALAGVNMEIRKNAMIAIVGGSGAGKSTLADVIAGLRRPTSGVVRIDGEDLWSLDLAQWRKRIGYVTQDISVFNGTIRDNLTFAHPGAREEDIAQALVTANLVDVVSGLPDGLETVVGENGVRLSGGQRQRLALARALVGNPQLLILDEATSALDNESERLVQDALERIAHRITIVVIAHRLSTIRRADTIHVMEDGRIVEHGSYESLLAQGGRFSDFHRLQID